MAASNEMGGNWEHVAPPVSSAQPTLDAIRLEDARAMAIATWVTRVKVAVLLQAFNLVVFFVYGYAISSLVGVAMIICGFISVYSKGREPTFAYLILVPLSVVKDFVVVLTYNPHGFLLGIFILDMMLGLVAGYLAFFLYRNLTITRLNFGDDSHSASGQAGFAPPHQRYDPNHPYPSMQQSYLDVSDRSLNTYSPDTAGM